MMEKLSNLLKINKMELKKNPSANLEKFKLLFLVISFIISLGATVIVFEYQSKAADKQAFNTGNATEDEDIVKITRQDIKPPEEVKPPQKQQVVETIIIKENDEQIDVTTEFDNTFNENDAIDLGEGMDEEVESIFVYVEHMPEFPGGVNALRSYVATHIKYPIRAQEADIQGTVYLRFEVTKSGKVGKVELQKGVDPLLDDEAIRVVKNLPSFSPGIQNGKAVNVWFSLPIVFQLAN